MTALSAVTVAGAGLAGCEAAWQLARRGVPVTLVDMKPAQRSPAHHESSFAELVCSNSLKSNLLDNAAGLLKEEMRRLGSLIIRCAEQAALPAGTALAVDRQAFSRLVTDALSQSGLISFCCARLEAIPDEGIAVIATGPLTGEELCADIQKQLGRDILHFHDAAAPIVFADSIDQTIAFMQSRYQKGSADYLNCPFDQAAYERFQDELVCAERVALPDFEKAVVFEGCMPIEEMARRGQDTIRHGPLRPVGLIDPRTGRRPYACAQLRQDNRAASLYNLVGFQTRLRFPEQQRVFRLIPGLAQAEFARFGVMHRNVFIDSPRLLEADYSARSRPNLFFAGQMTGVEGYVESAASGLVAGWQAANLANGIPAEQRRSFLPSARTVTGALARYVSCPRSDPFQPMNANWGILEPPADAPANREKRREAMIRAALAEIDQLAALGI